MRERLLGVTGILVLLAAATWLFWPQGPERLYDADLRPLAMSYEEGYCSGVTYWQTNGKGSARAAKNCRAEHEKNDSRDLTRVVVAFCTGAIEQGFSGQKYKGCVDPITAQGLWPTLDGQLSGAFNQRYPYPGEVFVVAVTDDAPSGRVGDREGFSR